MAVATLLTGLEERLDILIEDDDVEAEDFMSFGRLLAFAQRKVAANYSAAEASNSCMARNFSASSAAMQPVPAAVTAWR